MSKNTDTRALTREAYPHIIATGDNASVLSVKNWVRNMHGMPDWNPSATTIQDELKTIRMENGRALLNGVQFPGIDPLLAELTGEYFQKIHAMLRESADSELEATRRKVMDQLVEAKTSVQAAQEQVVSLQADLSQARIEFERREIKLASDIEHHVQTISELRQSLQDLGATHSASEARNVELARQVERISAERIADANRHDSQLKLADERYRELEKAKLMELDNAKTQRDRAQAELATVKTDLAEVRIQVGVKSIEAAEIRGEARALRDQVVELTDRINGLQSANNQLQNEYAVLEQDRNSAVEQTADLERTNSELEAKVKVESERNAQLQSEVSNLRSIDRKPNAE